MCKSVGDIKWINDHRSYECNLSNCNSNLRLQKMQASTGFEPMTFALPVRCSTNWARKPHIGSRSIVSLYNRDMNEMRRWIYDWNCLLDRWWWLYFFLWAASCFSISIAIHKVYVLLKNISNTRLLTPININASFFIEFDFRLPQFSTWHSWEWKG